MNKVKKKWKTMKSFDQRDQENKRRRMNEGERESGSGGDDGVGIAKVLGNQSRTLPFLLYFISPAEKRKFSKQSFLI